MLTLAAIIVFFLKTLRVVFVGAAALDSLTAAVFCNASPAALVAAHNAAVAIVLGNDSPALAADPLAYMSVRTYLTAVQSTPDTHAVHVAQYVAAHTATALNARGVHTTLDTLGYRHAA